MLSLHFCLDATQSPTHFNLCRYLQEENWTKTSTIAQADFSDENLQFDLQTANQLEYKHLLAELVDKYCPELMPATYCINDQNWPLVLNQLIDEQIWILKPALQNNGKNIKIFQKLADLERHFLSTNRLGGEHVLQQYLLNPHLLRDKRKYSIRMFLITTNYGGSFLYPQGYYNIALHSYAENDYSDLRSHLTNEHLQDSEANVLQIPSERFPAFASLYPQIKAMLTTLIESLEQANPKAFLCNKTRKMAIFGVDFLVDNQGRLWLLEANHGPCFPLSDEHPLQHYLYADFWKNLIRSFVLPIARNQPTHSIQTNLFELLQTRAKTGLKSK